MASIQLTKNIFVMTSDLGKKIFGDWFIYLFIFHGPTKSKMARAHLVKKGVEALPALLLKSLTTSTPLNTLYNQ